MELHNNKTYLHIQIDIYIYIYTYIYLQLYGSHLTLSNASEAHGRLCGNALFVWTCVRHHTSDDHLAKPFAKTATVRLRTRFNAELFRNSCATISRRCPGPVYEYIYIYIYTHMYMTTIYANK